NESHVPDANPGWTPRDGLSTLRIVPAPTTALPFMRRTSTDIVLVHARWSAQLAGMSAAVGGSWGLLAGVGPVRIRQVAPSNTSRSRAFQYSGRCELIRITSLPSRGQVIGP